MIDIKSDNTGKAWDVIESYPVRIVSGGRVQISLVRERGVGRLGWGVFADQYRDPDLHTTRVFQFEDEISARTKYDSYK